MNVAINAVILPSKLTGVGYYTQCLIKSIIENEPDIHLTLFISKGSAEYFKFSSNNFHIHTVPFKSSILKTLYLQLILPFSLDGFDLVHTVTNTAVIFTKKIQILTIFDLYHKIIPKRFGILKRLYYSFIFKISIRSSNKIITCSQNTKNDLLKFYGNHLEEKISVTYLGSKFPLNPEIKSHENYILFVGTLEPGKNALFAIKLLKMLNTRKNQKIILKIIGTKGWDNRHMKAIKNEVEASNFIEVLSYVSDNELSNYYQNALCLIFPSIYEGFGLPVLEAQNLGCPVVAANNSSIPEVMGDGGLLFPNNDLEKAVSHVNTLIDDENLRNKIIKKGFENAKNFSWVNCKNKTIEIYRSVFKPSMQ